VQKGLIFRDISFLLMLSLLPLCSFSQENKRHYHLVFSSAYGSILRHSPRMGKLASRHFLLYEFSLRHRTDGSREWHAVHRHPEYGVDLGLADFQNPVLGKAFYGIVFMEKSLINLPQNSRSAIHYKLGNGLFYTTNPYSYENFQNVALSSRLGYALRGEIIYQCRLSPELHLRAMLLFTHFSNASLKQPNAGVNVPMVGFGISYMPAAQSFMRKPDTMSHAFKNGFSVNLAGAFTVKEIGLPGGKKYWGGNLIAYVGKRITRKSGLNAGFDLFFNTAQRRKIEKDTMLTNPVDYKQAAVTVGHEFFINRLSILSQLGVYVYAPYPNEAPFYVRNLLKYWVSERFFCGISLKNHYGIAEYAEWTVGTRLGW
jgi:hypothetical protein